MSCGSTLRSLGIAIGFLWVGVQPAHGICTGDCNGDMVVRIDELIRGVAIALGTQPLDACPAFDADGDEMVAINELVSGVNAALFECGATPPTPRSTSTPTQIGSHSPSPTLTGTASLTTIATETPTPEATPTTTLVIIDLGPPAVVNELDRSVTFTGGRQSRQAGATSDSVSLDGIPRAIAIADGGLFAYVTMRMPDAVAVIDIAQRRVAGVITGVESLPEAIACTPDGNTLVVTNFGANSVSIIDAAALRAGLARRRAGGVIESTGMMDSIAVGTAPNGLAIAAEGARAYVTNYGSRSVSVIDIAGRSVMDTVTVGDNPNSVAISPDGQFAYVSDFTSMSLSVISTASNALVRTIPINFFAETRPTALAFSPTGLLYVTSFNVSFGELFGSVLIFNTASDPPLLVDQLDYRDLGMTGALPAATRVSVDGDVAFISNFLVEQDEVTAELRASAAGGTLLMVDTASNSMLDAVPVGNFPVSLAVGAAVASAPTPTPGPTLTPAAGERCGATNCLPPSVCSRDLGCHRNGCAPRDKCCPPEMPGCAACLGGDNDGAACAGADDCPGGQCAP